MNYLARTAVAALLLIPAASLVAGDWPNYRGPNDDAVVQVNVPDKLTVATVWKVPLGNSFGQIAIEGGKAFAFIQRDEDEFAVCLDAKTGHELWAKKIDVSIRDKNGGDGPRSTPAVSGDRVYILGTHRKLVCLDLAGNEIWRHDIKEELGGKELQWGSAVSPVVVDDLVIVVGGGPGKGIAAYNKTTGVLAWAKTDEMSTHATPTVATILGKKQAICFMQSGLVSVDPKTGDVLWTFAHPYKVSTAASPVVGGKNGDIVFCSAGYKVGAAACRISKEGDKWTATKLWRTENQNLLHWSTAVYHDGYIYGIFGQNGTPVAEKGGTLACLDIETGESKWSKGNIGSQGGLIVLGNKLLIQTPAGNLLLVGASPDKYTEFGKENVLQGKNWTAPSFADGMVFIHNTGDGAAPAEGACVKLTN